MDEAGIFKEIDNLVSYENPEIFELVKRIIEIREEFE